MTFSRFCATVRISLLVVLPFGLLATAISQGAKKSLPALPIADADADHLQQRSKWFLHGRVVPGKVAADLRHRAYQAKMQARIVRANSVHSARPNSQSPPPASGEWTPLGPVPLTSNASGSSSGQNYNQVSGRATAVAIDPADTSGNTIYIGGAQGGVWKSTNAANSTANNVTWTPVTDDQATLSIGAIAIQPGNTVAANSVILVGTGEADNSADSYFGLGMLRSRDGGNQWALISTANSGALSFAGLGATRMAFSTANASTVVAAMAATTAGETDGTLTSNTNRGLYTSTDAGQTWTFDSLFSGGAGESTSATSVVYNASAGLFFAALRYHGFYSSPDGLNWTRLVDQPGAAGELSTTACPQNYSTSCPIYRGEIAVVPGRNEVYVWFISLDVNGNPVDQGIWQSLNGGASWAAISDSGVTNCGDFNGCGVEQGFYNLALLAIPNGTAATDLYAGAINLYKCSIDSANSSCASTPFINLTHVYGCNPIAGPAHVHPDQHAMAFAIPSNSGADLMYFANDGGIYRALNGFTGLTTGSCSGTNQFDDLNQNLGSMTQFVSFSEHPTNAEMLLGGTQDNGSPATVTVTTSSSWGNVLSGDGGYNAIDPNTSNWFASNPDTGAGTLNIQECAAGVNCNDSLFNVVVNSSSVGGDDGAFYFPYILDPQSTTSLLVGTCRVWRGPRSGGSFSLLSLNFDTLGTGICAGTEVNTVLALAAGGPSNANGSEVIYATTDGPGPNNLSTPIGGNVWVTTNAAAVSGTSSTFNNVTLDGPGGNNINPNQFPISSVAVDTSDTTGNTAYVTVMGFTGGPGHVWQTTNAGASWTDFSGSSPSAIPDSPANAVVIDPSAHVIYVGTDVGVFQSSTSSPAWTEVGPTPNALGGSVGFLPNVAVTGLALFDSGGQKLLRASTYGRGVWQSNLLAVPTFEIQVANNPLTVFGTTSAIFNGTITALNGYSSLVTLSCTAGSTAPPVPCDPPSSPLTPSPAGTPFSVTTGSVIGDYSFNLVGVGSDANDTTLTVALVLHVVNFGITTPSPGIVAEPRGATSSPVSFQVTAQGSFNQSVTVSCSFAPVITGATCAFTPGAVVNPTAASPVNMTATVTVPATAATGSYTVTLAANTSGAPTPATTSFVMTVTTNPDFIFSETSPFPNVKVGSTGVSGPIAIASQDGFGSAVALSCVTTYGANSCSVNPASVSTFPASVNLVINGTSFAAGSYQVAVQGTSGSITNTFPVAFNVGDYSLAGSQTLSSPPASQATANFTITSLDSYSGAINATCDASQLPAAQCTISPQNPIAVGAGAVVNASALINVPNDAIPGVYNIKINTVDTSGTPSHSVAIALTVLQDFSLSLLTPSTQTITAGQSASYNFSVLPVGASFTGAVSFSCSGQPEVSLCTFTPTQVTPGTSSAAVVLQISTTSSSASVTPALRGGKIYYALWLMLPGLCLIGLRRGRRSKLALPSTMLGLFLLAWLLTSCGGGGTNGGGGGGGGGGQQQGTPPGTYSISVVGTSGALTHQSSPITLGVN